MRGNRNIRHIIDTLIVLSSTVIVLPISLIISLLILIVDGPPIFFKQERVGKDGKLFQIYKFRTMKSSNDVTSLVTSKNDVRITPLGAFLRNWKIDELPQFVNVLKGEMSLIGPRPEVAPYLEMWPNQAKVNLLTVKPGIVDSLTLSFLNEEAELAKSPNPEQFYIENILPQKIEYYGNVNHKAKVFADYSVLIAAILYVLRNAKK